MSITAGAASNKISELRSKLAVYDAWVDLIRQNYLPSDGGPPETPLMRDDGGRVTPEHFQSVMEDIETRCSEIREELAEWEGLVFEPVKGQVTQLHPSNDATPPPQVKKASGKKPIGAARLQPATK